MPVPAADGSDKALNPFGTSGVLPDSDHAWQLELTTVVLSTLDRKFSEQEALLRELLAPSTVELSGESSVALVEKVEAVNSAEAMLELRLFQFQAINTLNDPKPLQNPYCSCCSTPRGSCDNNPP